jgi:hypothetical protein
VPVCRVGRCRHDQRGPDRRAASTSSADALYRLRARVAARAVRLFADKRDDAAFRLVRPLFAGRDPLTTAPDVVLADAAIVYVQSYDDHDHRTDVPWAQYACDTNRRLRGVSHPRTLEATEILAEAHEWRGQYAPAARVWQSLAAGHEQLEQTDQADLARLRQAICLHTLGRCGEAIRLASRSWDSWCRTEDRNPADGAGIVGPYMTMLTLSGRDPEALTAQAAARGDLPVRFWPGTPLFQLASHQPESFEPGVHDRVCARHRQPGDGQAEP